MMTLRKALGISLYLLMTILATAQCNHQLTLLIKDTHHNGPLEYATVFIKETKSEVYSDSTGRAVIDNLCSGTYHLSIFHAGCPTVEKFVEIKASDTLTIYLDHHDEILSEVQVIERSQNAQAGKMISSVHRDQIFEATSLQLSEVIQRIPGVSMVKTGPTVSKPIINGMVGQRLTIINQGISQEGQQWGLDHAPEIDASAADKISVIQGPASIRYGMNAMGGAIVIEPSPQSTDPHIHGEASLIAQSNGRMIGTQIRLRQNHKLGAWNAYGSWSLSGDRRTSNYYLTNTGQRLGSFGFNIVRSSTKWTDTYSYSFYRSVQGILRGAHVGNLTDLASALTREVPFYTNPTFGYSIEAPRQWVNHHTANAQRTWSLGTRSSVLVNVGTQLNQRQEYDVRRSNRSDRPALSMDLINVFAESIWKQKSTNQKTQFSTGIQYKYIYNVNNPETGISPLIPDYSQQNIGAFASIFHKLNEKSQVEIGARYDFRYLNAGIIEQQSVFFKKYRFGNKAGTIGYRYTNGETKAYSEFAVHSRPPDVSELHSNGLHQGVSGIELGNASLNSENMIRVSQSFQTDITSKSHVQLTVHAAGINDFIYLLPTGETRLTIRGAFPLYKYTSIDALMAGAFGQWIYENKQWQTILSGQYTHGSNVDPKEGLVRIPPIQTKATIQYTIPKIGTVQDLKFGIETIITGRQHEAALSDDFLAPPSGYGLQNVFARTKVNVKQGRTMDLFVRVDNLWNRSYRDYLNRWRYFADEIGRNVSLNAKINF